MYTIAFDIGGTGIKLGIVSEGKGSFEIIEKIIWGFPKGENPDFVVATMVAMIDEILKATGLTINDMQGIGISVAGSVDKDKKNVINSHNIGFHQVPLGEKIKKYYPNMEIKIINDADAATLAEHQGGRLKNIKTAVLLTIGTGIGGGIILNGELFQGGLGHGNELGHMTLMQGGPLCTCGNRGCIETLCSASWLVSEGKKVGFEKIKGAKDVIDLAKKGNLKAIEVFEEYLDYLSSAIASIAVLLDPEVIVLGGGVSGAGDFLFEPLRDLVERKTFFKIRYKILPAKFGNDAGILGASALLRRIDGV